MEDDLAVLVAFLILFSETSCGFHRKVFFELVFVLIHAGVEIELRDVEVIGPGFLREYITSFIGDVEELLVLLYLLLIQRVDLRESSQSIVLNLVSLMYSLIHQLVFLLISVFLSFTSHKSLLYITISLCFKLRYVLVSDMQHS